MEKTNIYRAYFYKLFCSPVFYICVIGAALVCSISFMNNLFQDLYMVMFMLTDFTMFHRILAVVCAVPFAANFAEEWRNGAANHYVVRCGVRKYAVSNAVLCFISSVLTAFLGMTLFFFVCSFFLPVYKDSTSLEGVDELFLASNFQFGWIIVKDFCFAIGIGMWSMLGMTLSAFFPDKYIAICSPLITSYVFERLTNELPLPICVSAVTNCRIGWSDKPVLQIIYCVLAPTALAAVMTAVFAVTVKRRVQNELT